MPERRHDIACLGELNADIVAVGAWPEPGREVLAREGALVLGSSTAIFAADCARAGLRVAICGLLGRDPLGDFVLAELERARVAPLGVRRRADVRTGFTVSLTGTGDRALVTYPGAMAALGAGDVAWEVIADAGHLHVSSPYLQEALLPDLPAVLARARALGLTVSVDPGWDPRAVFVDLLPALAHVDLLLPNEAEALALARAASVEEAASALAARVPLLVIKRGERGALAVEGGQVVEVPAAAVEVVDATGAGDGFNAGFLWARLGGHALIDCLRVGAFAGAAVTRAPGGTASFPGEAELNAALAAP